MGRSPRFCFSIKACAGASPDGGDDSTLLESKSSPEKRKWGFRKKFVGRRIPSNTVISEPLHVFSENQHQESTSDTFYSENSPSEPEKDYIVEQTISTLLSPVVSSVVPTELASAATGGVDYDIPEHVIVVIQTSIRRCLAKKELQKLRHVVKLQAAARGYLVRRQAAGTLRCIQAIIKIQALVRARHSVQLTDLSKKHNDKYIPADMGKQSDMEQNKTPSAIRKSVSSAFARQLLESTPKTNPIYISCDPSRRDSAWNWLERWMALTSTSQQNLVLYQDDLSKDMKTDLSSYDVDVGLHFIHGHASSHSELTANSQVLLEFEGNQIANTSKRVQFPVESVDMENDKSQSKRGASKHSDQQPLDASLHFELDGSPYKPDFTEDNFKNIGRKELNEAPEIQGKAVNEHRKLMNPAFTAAQAKFEELSSGPASNRYSNHSSQDVVSIPKTACSMVNFQSDEVIMAKSVCHMVDNKVKEVDLKEKLSNPNPEGQVAASGAVTEISVVSPDRTEAIIPEIIPEIRTLDEINLNVKSVTDISLKFEDVKIETERNGAISVGYVEEAQVQKQSTETTISSIRIQEEGTEDTNIYRKSHNESPRSYTDFRDSPVTPSSQIPIRIRTAKAGNSISARRKSPTAVTNSPTSSKSDSGARSSQEHLWKGTKNVKRPNSSGNNRAHVGHDSSSSSSLPGYMQLTESAKAKISTSFSQKPNASIHHEDDNLKKRYSLPIGNEKLGLSPRVHSSASQPQQALERNGVSSHNFIERRWQI